MYDFPPPMFTDPEDEDFYGDAQIYISDLVAIYGEKSAMVELARAHRLLVRKEMAKNLGGSDEAPF